MVRWTNEHLRWTIQQFKLKTAILILNIINILLIFAFNNTNYMKRHNLLYLIIYTVSLYRVLCKHKSVSPTSTMSHTSPWMMDSHIILLMIFIKIPGDFFGFLRPEEGFPDMMVMNSFISSQYLPL